MQMCHALCQNLRCVCVCVCVRVWGGNLHRKADGESLLTGKIFRV